MKKSAFNFMKDKTKDKDDLSDIMYSYDSDNKILEENLVLKQTVNQLMEEIRRFKTLPLMVCEVKKVMDKQAIIKIPNGNSFLVQVMTDKKIKPGDIVYVDQKFLNIVDKADETKNPEVENFVIVEKPKISWEDIGGLKEEKEKIREVVELPLKQPELFKKVGIQPPKGILLYGPPGTGKTLLAKAVASQTNSTFIEIVGSELVQKFIGEGAKLVKEIFQLAREKAPSIVFIDEIDSLAAKRIEMGTSGEREVQRTFMQLLAEIDGFNNLGNVKIIAATNRKDILDPAILRPGRLERQLEIKNPDLEGVKEILKIHTKKMNLDKKIKLEELAEKMKGFSGAEIKAVVTEAGYNAIRNKRSKVIKEDFEEAIKKLHKKEEEKITMFG